MTAKSYAEIATILQPAYVSTVAVISGPKTAAVTKTILFAVPAWIVIMSGVPTADGWSNAIICISYPKTVQMATAPSVMSAAYAKTASAAIATSRNLFSMAAVPVISA